MGGVEKRPAASGSLRPWPVTTQTTREPASGRSRRSAAIPAADAGSQKTPSSWARSRQAPRISSSASGTVDPPERAIASSASSRCAGSAMRMAVAIVYARAEASPTTKGGRSPAASSKPSAYARVLPPPPYGSASASGVPPSSSTISNTAVFWPSSRYGLSEFTSE